MEIMRLYHTDTPLGAYHTNAPLAQLQVRLY